MKILRNSLLLLAASSIAFTSCNKKEEEILEELEEIKNAPNETPYIGTASASFSLVGKNTSNDSDHSNFNYSFDYKYLDKEDLSENRVTVSRTKGQQTVNDVESTYDYYQKNFTTTIYELDDYNNVAYSPNGSITISFKMYEGTLSQNLKDQGATIGTPYQVYVAYDSYKALTDNDYWNDNRDGMHKTEITDDSKVITKERFTLTNFSYDDITGALTFSITGSFDGTDIDGTDATVALDGKVTSVIYKEFISPDVN